ncbi:hypothetical protein I568_00857 [Enterococcus columbae DSM 7374 = ATCC 51263]|uniref:Uncharacterized protein n=2 Tax=Enterococcus columbae TaxID=1355 RepID=S0KH96_9ENTE|nr:hypothetical protein OMW_00259 [Enterococcus columbae DSM 7374 = ATCC 51263]EOW84362.1 hypothetical protein I568_00857 [Enterococcus columbae DSM 7374 = ATCC 51263]
MRMMNSWRFYIVVNILLVILSLWQIVGDIDLTIFLLLGSLSLFLHYTRRKKVKNINLLLWIGCVFIFISLINSYAFWLILIFNVLFLALKGFEFADIDFSSLFFWRKKQIIMVATKEPEKQPEPITRQKYFGSQIIGNQVYAWDDINLSVLAGDTIIDLGNTLLPKKQNIILLRKGFGRTRILVPQGIGLEIQHVAFRGDLHVDNTVYALNQEQIIIHETLYTESERKLKIISNVFIGDVEVIRI